jgi:UDP-N-acetylglucosamine--N-acetylmuramyl-(pentapeptide) pyrophosphoryl-undecaprenol N-acetylglucosamine transferase
MNSVSGIKIILTGGGTLGSVSPLIAIWQFLKERVPEARFVFIGTKNGPEKELIKKYDLSFDALPTAKFRRYFSLLNFLDFFKFCGGLIGAFFLITRHRPKVIVSAGGFTAVPLVWISYFFRDIKIILYQPDIKLGLANKLCQHRADMIFTAFSETLSNFNGNNAYLAGSVVRVECKNTPVNNANGQTKILILGGGSGAKFINDMIADALPELTVKYSIVHVVGKNKSVLTHSPNYAQYELLKDDYYQKIAEADLIISRAGLSTLMELAYMSKPVILIPLPKSPQVANSRYFAEMEAAITIKQEALTKQALISAITDTIENRPLMDSLKRNIGMIFNKDGEERIAHAIVELCK